MTSLYLIMANMIINRGAKKINKQQCLTTFLWGIVLVLHCTAVESTLVPPNYSLSIHSRCNYTGHWIVSVDTAKKVPLNDGIKDADRGLSVAVDLTSTVEDGTATTRLTSVATLGLPAVPGCQMNGTSRVPAMVKSITKGYDKYKNLGYYKFHKDTTTWSIARQVCENENAHLVVINSEEELEMMGEIMKSHNVLDIFAGFNDLVAEGQYYTIHGEPLSSTYVRWARLEPNDFNHNEDCGALIMRDNQPGLNDVNCGWRVAFICELRDS